MILVLSPSKTLDFAGKLQFTAHSQPQMLSESQLLVKKLQTYTPARLSTLMDISDKLAALNASRYQSFQTPFTPANARQAILAFKGDVYEGMDVSSYNKKDFEFAQEHVRILSGLYGLLRPLDLIQPYRLEMGTKLPNPRGKDLYGFWGDRITQALNLELAKAKNSVLINLASEEYFKAVRPKSLKGELVNIVFKEQQKGQLKIIGLFAKKARGLMASYIVRNRIDNIKDILEFQDNGYGYAKSLSGKGNLVFVRKLS